MEITASERVGVDGVVETDGNWLRLRLSSTVDGVEGILPEIELSKGWIGTLLPRDGYLAF
jgi:hypothetical protein